MRPLILPRAVFVLLGLFAAVLGYARLASPVLLAAPMTAEQVAHTAIGGDFRQLWAQGHLAATGQAAQAYVAGAIAAHPPVTALGQQISQQPSFYPPTTLMLLAPLGSLDFATAWWVYSWGSLVLLAAVLCLLLYKQVELLAFAFGFSGIWVALSFGQNSLVLTSLYLILLWGAARYPLPAGVALGLASFKPHLGLLAPLVLLLRRQFKLIFITVLAVIALGLLSFSYLGADVWLAYQNSVLAPMQRLAGFEHITSHQLISTFGTLRHLAVPINAALIGQITISALALICLVAVCHRAVSPQLPIAALVLAGLLFTPHAYTYDLALLLVPLLTLVRRAQSHGWQVMDFAVVALLYLAPVLHNMLQPQLGLSPVPLILLASLAYLVHLACGEDEHG